MKVACPSLLLAVIISAVTIASGQTSQSSQKNEQVGSSITSGDTTTTSSDNKREESPILIHLVGGGKLEVQEVIETRDGVWYKRGGVTALIDSKRVLKIERPSSSETAPSPVPGDRGGTWSLSDSRKVQNFFLTKFGRPLPVSAFGQSDLHDRWGLDHRQGVDVGLHPDSVEGLALVEFLKSEGIPFLVFRGPIPGVATGPHIHIGRPSHRYLPR